MDPKKMLADRCGDAMGGHSPPEPHTLSDLKSRMGRATSIAVSFPQHDASAAARRTLCAKLHDETEPWYEVSQLTADSLFYESSSKSESWLTRERRPSLGRYSRAVERTNGRRRSAGTKGHELGLLERVISRACLGLAGLFVDAAMARPEGKSIRDGRAAAAWPCRRLSASRHAWAERGVQITGPI